MSSRSIEEKELLREIQIRGQHRRSLTAIAGAPGSGKSTIAEKLAAELNDEEAGSASVFPMDGYHYDDLILNARGWRPRKGAPHTFDVAGFGQMLLRLRTNNEEQVAVPVFDRDIEISRNSARLIDRNVRHVIVEGNYLLLDEAPWRDLAEHFDTTVFLDVPIKVLETRLAQRWQHLETTERTAKLEKNDLPNARQVNSRSRPSEFVLN